MKSFAPYADPFSRDTDKICGMITLSTAAGRSPYVRNSHATSFGRSSNSTVMSRLISNPSRDGNSTNWFSTNDSEEAGAAGDAEGTATESDTLIPAFLSPAAIFVAAEASLPSRMPELDSDCM